MIIESWVYRAVPGRLPDLLNRFETTTVRIFKRHGFKPLGFFTTLVGESHQELTYLLVWDSAAEREQRWATFLVDPEWRAVRAETEKNGPLVENTSNKFLVPTSFSPRVWSGS